MPGGKKECKAPKKLRVRESENTEEEKTSSRVCTPVSQYFTSKRVWSCGVDGSSGASNCFLLTTMDFLFILLSVLLVVRLCFS